MHQLGIAQRQVRVRPEMGIGDARGLRKGEVEPPVLTGDRLSPRDRITVSGFLLALAMSRVGCSRKSPLIIMRSASERSLAIDGVAAKVWEFTPSGITPSSWMRGPPMFSTMLVIGETVVTTFRRFVCWSAF